MSELKSLVEKYSNQAKIASQNDKVYKDECMLSYDTSESSDGLYVCLNKFIGVSKNYLPLYFEKTGSHLYLKTKTWRREIVQTEQNDEPEKKKPSKFGIGIEGGFDLNDKQFYFDHEYSLYIYPEDKEIKLVGDNTTNESISDNVSKSLKSIINAQSINYKEELAAQAAVWDGEKRFVSKHSANLVQIPNPPQVSPNPESWKCDLCDIRKNLWLNLSDGKILCGRKQLDGSGGNNHAVEYYSSTKYPLAVKLGTITATGADVYSYNEDDMVEDTNLAVHLSHFGINMSKMKKSDKTMAELEIDLNQKVGEWDRIQESGSKLVPLYGPNFTGMRNLGNSCYMNSVMQVIFTMPDFLRKYLNNRDAYLKNSAFDASNDFNFQMSKLAYGLISGEYSKVEEPEQPGLLRAPKGIKPISFKSLIGKGHAEFSTKRQQDAHEFFMHLISLIERNLRNDTANNTENPADCLKFKMEERIECAQSHNVKYTYKDDYCLSVPISKDLALNKDKLKEFEQRKADLESKGEKLQPGDIVRPEISLTDCLRLLAADEQVTDFYSSATKSKGIALKSTRLATFPDFLLIQAKKFEFAADWSPIKLDVSLQVPDVLDISELRGSGKKPNEQELPEDEIAGTPQIVLNESIVQQLMDMGFSLEGSKRAAFNTRQTNDPEAAVNWAVAHMEDSDFNSPFELPTPAAKKQSNKKEYDEESIASITGLGFSKQQAIKALDSTNGDVVRAADWIFSHMDELMDTADSNQAQTSEPRTEYRDGSGKYKLVAFISHMGTNANVGHYVAHILKDDKWCIFNDENVALSENPPKDLAYLYLFKRI